MQFILAHPESVAFTVWVGITVLALLRYFAVDIFQRISWTALLVSTIAFYFAYSGFLTGLQYARWESGNQLTQVLAHAPLPPETPLPLVLEWARGIFAHQGGYFAFYSFTHFFLGNLILFTLALGLALLLALRARYRPTNFAKGDIIALLIAVLVSGWPGVVVLIPLGFIIALCMSVAARLISGVERIYLPPAFLFAALVVVIFGSKILSMAGLLNLLIP